MQAEASGGHYCSAKLSFISTRGADITTKGLWQQVCPAMKLQCHKNVADLAKPQADDLVHHAKPKQLPRQRLIPQQDPYR